MDRNNWKNWFQNSVWLLSYAGGAAECWGDQTHGLYPGSWDKLEPYLRNTQGKIKPILKADLPLDDMSYILWGIILQNIL